MHTTNTLVAGKTVVVAGYGYCGKGIAMRARGMGARVIVTEIDPVKAIEANLDGFEIMQMDDAAPLGDYFITATGCEDVITSQHFEKMRDNAFLANAGHFNVEVNLEQLSQMSTFINERREDIVGYQLEDGRVLNVLAEGRLVNLAAGNGHPAEIMDMSFSLQSLGLKYLVNNQGKLENKVYDIPDDVDYQVAWIKLNAMGYTIDELTSKQRAYLGL
jgi:adenosylhomocysteinase